jgi:hypothetical protein
MKSWKPRSAVLTDLLPAPAPVQAPVPAGLAAAQTPAMRAYAGPVDAAGAPAAALAEAAPPPPDPPRLPQEVLTWLTQLNLLYGVPFEYLVADPRLLPPESLRFFFVDRNWTDRLTDGALSVGTASTREDVFNNQFYAAIYAQVDESLTRLRASLRGEDAPAGSAGTLTGLLFRSVVVGAWPGLEVYPSAGGQPLRILRMDHLSPDVLLCIFDGVPDSVEIVEPGEGLHFGVVGGAGSGPFEVYLRGLGFGTYPAGVQIGSTTVQGNFRSGPGQPAGVVDVAGLQATLQSRLAGLKALDDAGVLGPGGFAVQMVLGAGRQPFTTVLKGSDASTQPAAPAPGAADPS